MLDICEAKLSFFSNIALGIHERPVSLISVLKSVFAIKQKTYLTSSLASKRTKADSKSGLF